MAKWSNDFFQKELGVDSNLENNMRKRKNQAGVS